MKKIDERWKAIISAVAVIIVNAAALLGFDLGDGASIQNALLGMAWIASIFWAIWKNHNFTFAAGEGQRVTDAIKEIAKDAHENVSAETALELTESRGVKNDVQ